MQVISSKEFATHQDKYFNMAIEHDVCIQKGQQMFQLIYTPVEKQIPKQPILEPDDDLRSAITGEELKASAREFIHQLFAGKK